MTCLGKCLKKEDHGRMLIADFTQITEYETAEEYVDGILDYIKNPFDYYHIPRWHEQAHYVEIWIDTMVGPFKNYLKSRHVPIAFNKGNTGYQFFTDNCKRLEEIHDQFPEKKIHILYFGDFDPTQYTKSHILLIHH